MKEALRRVPAKTEMKWTKYNWGEGCEVPGAPRDTYSLEQGHLPTTACSHPSAQDTRNKDFLV